MAKQSIQQYILLTGTVQGVGFRPFTYQLANELGLKGAVRNQGGQVEIFAEGTPVQLSLFITRLKNEKPELAQITSITCAPIIEHRVFNGFEVSPSNQTDQSASAYSLDGEKTGSTPPDLGVCQECLKELFTKGHRRYLYPFISCSKCGPRYSIIRQPPYDRQNTSMTSFPLCEACTDDYRDIENRRFHTEAIACPNCGPQLEFISNPNSTLETPSPDLAPIDKAVSIIKKGGIIAVKGIGGFHLLCDANQAQAVLKLRKIKSRPVKPLALMALNTASIKPYVKTYPDNTARLESIYRPLVLLPGRQESFHQHAPLWQAISPGLSDLGIMLPYTPIHFLLFHRLLNSPEGLDWLDKPCSYLFVMTSANPKDSPIQTDYDQFEPPFSDQIDGFLNHNRTILNAADDSILQSGSVITWIRQGRGVSPQRIGLSQTFSTIFSCGALLKNTVCVIDEKTAYLSPYIGDLDTGPNIDRFQYQVDKLINLVSKKPKAVCADLHPDFWSTQFAENLAHDLDIPSYSVQHHHAHCLSVLAEHKISLDDGKTTLALILDGYGLGTDNEAWGGEMLLLNGISCKRLGHLSKLPLPGGDKAALQPWRIGIAALNQLGITSPAFYHQEQIHKINSLLNLEPNPIPYTSSAGRWFDLAASLLDICQTNQFEAQAAMYLSSLTVRESYPAQKPGSSDSLAVISNNGNLDLWPLIPQLVEFKDSQKGAYWFLSAFTSALLDWTNHWADKTQCHRIVLSGGCFNNQYLSTSLKTGLDALNSEILLPEQLPCNDSGISLGQAYYGAYRLLHDS